MDTPAPPAKLRTEYADRPTCVETESPQFSWIPQRQQTAYQVRVARTRDTIHEEPHWDSGRVRSETSVGIPYDGPSLETGCRYYWTVRVWDSDTAACSDWSDVSWWETGLKTSDWEASWIRRKPLADGFEDPSFHQLRREFVLEGAITRARVYVAAFHQAEVRINGDEVGRGQSFCYPDRQYYKSYDVTGHVRPGRNAIGVTNVWTGKGKGRPEGEPGLLLQLSIEYENGDTETIVSDVQWRTRDGPWMSAPERSPASREPIERIDGRRRAEGWTEPDFDDSEWDAPDVVGRHPASPWTDLVGQQRAIERSSREPETVRRIDEDTYLADFGRVYTGIPIAEFVDGEHGNTIDIRTGYRLDEDGHVSTTEGIQWTDMSYEYVQNDGDQTFRPFIFLAFRYAEIRGAGESLKGKIRMIEHHNGVPDKRAATFDSSNETINDVWELARHSALYGSQEQFLDTPTREKGQFVSDSLNISTTTMAAFRERKLTQQALEEFCDSQHRYWSEAGRVNAVYPTGEGKRDIPDYTQLFVEWVWQYYLWSGDRKRLRRMYPVLKSIADYVQRNIDPETGLVTELAGGDREQYRHGIVDWPEEMRYGYDMDAAALTTVNVLGVVVFRRLGDIASALDRSEADVDQYRSSARALTEAINDRLLAPDGVYIDGLYHDGARSNHASQHANAFPLAFDIVPDEVTDTVADHLVSRGMSMGPMTAYWLLEALANADRFEAIVDLLSEPDQDGWANILERGGTFTWESWKARDLPDDKRHIISESHAWGSTALVAIQRRILGVQVASPAADSVVIAPPSTGVEHAEGRVPTEQGPVVVRWERTDKEEAIGFRLRAEIPRNVTATIAVPSSDPGNTRVTIENEDIWVDGTVPSVLPEDVIDVRSRSDAVVCEVDGGSYQFDVR